MKAAMQGPGANQRSSIVVSVGVHVVVIALIASITFHYPISAFFGPSKDRTPTERIQYVDMQPRPRESVGNGALSKPPKRKAASKPAPLVAPTEVPSTLPPVPPPSVSSGAISGEAGGSGGAGAGLATGIEPALPDPRIDLRPTGRHVPSSLTPAQRNDSAVKAIYMAYREAEVAAEANRGKSPRDWTMEHNGQKYGIDSQYVYLGKFKLPSAILAALPFNYGGVDGRRIIENRNASWIQNDIYSHSQGLSEDDFRAAVKRIRERKDRERKEAEDRGKTSPTVP